MTNPYHPDKWDRTNTTISGAHDYTGYEPTSPSVYLIVEMLEYAANHDGKLDPFHAQIHAGHGDGLDEQWANLYRWPSLLDDSIDGDDCWT